MITPNPKLLTTNLRGLVDQHVHIAAPGSDERLVQPVLVVGRHDHYAPLGGRGTVECVEQP